MSKIEKPFGRVAKRIVIEADDKGTIRVFAFDVPLLVRPGVTGVPMDSREMVLALMKVTMDYTSALFNSMTLQKEGPDGKDKSNGKDKTSSE